MESKASNYKKGAYRERQARKLLEEEGYTVVRAAGSKGFADLVAFNSDHILFINVKLNQWPSPSEREAARSVQLPSNGEWLCYRYDKGSTEPRIATLAMFRL